MATLATPAHVSRTPSEFQISKWQRTFRAFDRSPWKVLAGISVFYFAITFTLASIRLFWFDELITFYIAKINSIAGIWSALGGASDPNPPLTHILVMWSMRLFGDGEVAVRLPAILAAFVGIVSLFLFLQRRVPVIYAACGVLFFMSTRAFDYSYEGRSYALMLAFTMLSLVLWRAITEDRRKNLAAAGLALTLAAAISSNYYCLLAFFPIAVGELVRTIQLRKIEFRVWLALAVGAIPLFFYLSFISVALAHFGPYAWNKPGTDFIYRAYVQMSGEMVWILVALLDAAIAIYFYQRASEGSSDPALLPRAETAAVITLLAYPAIGYAIAILRAGMISPRLVQPFCFGLAIVFALTAARVFRRHALPAFALLAVCFSWAVARSVFSANDILLENAAFHRVIKTLPPEGTLAVSDSLLALPLTHYAPKQISSRIVFPFDLAAIRQFKGEDSPEQNLWAGRSQLPLPLVSLESLQNSGRNFYIVGTRDDWFQKTLRSRNVPFRQLPINSDSGDLFEFFPLAHGPNFIYETSFRLTTDTAPGSNGTQ